MGGESLFEPPTKRPEEPAPPEAHEAAPGEKSRWRPRRIVVVVGIGALLLLLSGAISVYIITERLGNNVTRARHLPVPRRVDPARPPRKPLTFLLVGTDSRTDAGRRRRRRPGYRSEVLMLARLTRPVPAPRWCRSPADSWVDIPGRGPDKINAAYAFGGPPLLIKTVENLTAHPGRPFRRHRLRRAFERWSTRWVASTSASTPRGATVSPSAPASTTSTAAGRWRTSGSGTGWPRRRPRPGPAAAERPAGAGHGRRPARCPAPRRSRPARRGQPVGERRRHARRRRAARPRVELNGLEPTDVISSVPPARRSAGGRAVRWSGPTLGHRALGRAADRARRALRQPTPATCWDRRPVTLRDYLRVSPRALGPRAGVRADRARRWRRGWYLRPTEYTARLCGCTSPRRPPTAPVRPTRAPSSPSSGSRRTWSWWQPAGQRGGHPAARLTGTPRTSRADHGLQRARLGADRRRRHGHVAAACRRRRQRRRQVFTAARRRARATDRPRAASRRSPSASSSPPRSPPIRRRPACPLTLALGLLAGLALGVGGALARNALDISVKSPGAAARACGGTEPRDHRLRRRSAEAAADGARRPAVAPLGGVPAAAHEPAVRRRRQPSQGHRRHQLAAERGQDHDAWRTSPSRWPRRATGCSRSRPTCAARSSPTCSAWSAPSGSPACSPAACTSDRRCSTGRAALRRAGQWAAAAQPERAAGLPADGELLGELREATTSSSSTRRRCFPSPTPPRSPRRQTARSSSAASRRRPRPVWRPCRARSVSAPLLGTVFTMVPSRGPRAYAQYNSYYGAEQPSRPRKPPSGVPPASPTTGAVPAAGFMAKAAGGSPVRATGTGRRAVPDGAFPTSPASLEDRDEDSTDHRNHRPGRLIPGRAAARQGLRGPRPHPPRLHLQHRADRPPLHGSARPEAPAVPALRRPDRRRHGS